MFNVSVNDKKNIYRSKPVMNVDTTGSSGSIPKPLTYDYMPEGYPKKDGWSIEWDGNTEGKISVVGAPIYKFSDRVLTYEEFLSATYVLYDGGGQFSGMVSEGTPEQTQATDAVSVFMCLHGRVQIFVVGEDNAEAGGTIFPTKGLYARGDTKPFKLIKETITPMSTDFMPKNLNVVFRGELGHAPTSCNVTYNELRDWVERDIPVFAVFIIANAKFNITSIYLLTDSLGFVYYTEDSKSKSFVYKSDGTFVTQPHS